jgi:hypothetical protein
VHADRMDEINPANVFAAIVIIGCIVAVWLGSHR